MHGVRADAELGEGRHLLTTSEAGQLVRVVPRVRRLAVGDGDDADGEAALDRGREEQATREHLVVGMRGDHDDPIDVVTDGGVRCEQLEDGHATSSSAVASP